MTLMSSSSRCDARNTVGLPRERVADDLLPSRPAVREIGNSCTAQGHGSMRAALIYQHASTERDRRIAQEMAALVERERRPGGEDPDGSEGGAETG
jgi:hypothetical protein